MCGIFGVIAKEGSDYNVNYLNKLIDNLATLSESRGKDSSGITYMNNEGDTYEVFKSAMPITRLLKDKQLKKNREKHSNTHKRLKSNFIAFGHSRLVTNGSQLENDNNQPIVKEGIIAIHNGIIVNTDELWNKYNYLKRDYEIDTEVMPAMIRHKINQGKSTIGAVTESVSEIFGTVASAFAFNDRNEFILITNNGSLYILSNEKDILMFASEFFILNNIKDKILKSTKIKNFTIRQVKPQTGYHIRLNVFKITKFTYNKYNHINGNIRTNNISINIHNISIDTPQFDVLVDFNTIRSNPNASSEKKLLEYNINRIKELKRCTKCILSDTFPYIEFDEKGVCNYCRSYIPKNNPKPLEELKALVEPYKSKNGKPDCLIPYSGGRDSTFVLHMAKRELGLNPIAFTYDWGMVTDLARRNIARVCGTLGVENIIVAANIHRKRANIRKNINAWLKRPELGMIPLFMAGDKFFFHYCNQVKKQTGIKLNIWGINFLENTEFKTGFTGVKPDFNKEKIYDLSFSRKLKLFQFVGKNLLFNPLYLNNSVWDTLGSFISRYIEKKDDYFHFFDYYRWNEKEIEDLILREYDWEIADDTDSTWRIGDGTAAFYNYIYTLIAGFSENDTFRSNQIREGMISREEALEKIYEENQPRYNSLKWYLEIVGLDYERVIKTINNIPRLY